MGVYPTDIPVWPKKECELLTIRSVVLVWLSRSCGATAVLSVWCRRRSGLLVVARICISHSIY